MIIRILIKYIQETPFLDFLYFISIISKMFLIHWSPRPVIVSISDKQTFIGMSYYDSSGYTSNSYTFDT